MKLTELLEMDKLSYELPQLPYEYDALEPHIDEETMREHHTKHQAKYVAKTIRGDIRKHPIIQYRS